MLEENAKLKATAALEDVSELDEELVELKANELTEGEIDQGIAEFTLFDDEFVRLALRHKKPVQKMLQIIFNNPDVIINKVETQKEINISFDVKTVFLDAFAQDTEKIWYNIEIQRKLTGAPPERAFFQGVFLCIHGLSKGQSYKKLPKVWVIFIFEKDPYKEGKPTYTSRYHNEDRDNKIFVDNLNIMYVNGEFSGDSPIGWLIHDLHCKNPDDMLIPELAEVVRYYKFSKKGRQELTQLVKRLFANRQKEWISKVREARAETEEARAETEEARAETKEARAETKEALAKLSQAVRVLVETCNFTKEQAAVSMNISVAEVDALLTQ